MKKLLLITALVLTASCSKEDECGCVKNVIESTLYQYTEGTLIKTGVRRQLKYTEDAGCQEPVDFVSMGNGLSYEIICN